MRPIIGITQDIEPRKTGGWRTYLDRSYQDAVYRHGGMPVALPVAGPGWDVAGLAGRLDGLLFSGGEDIHPRYFGEEVSASLELSPDERTDFELALLRVALESGIPVLGVCLGIQTINVFFGGGINQDIPGHKEAGRVLYHEARLAPGSLLERVCGPGPLTVNSTHHQSLGRLGNGLTPSAAAPDGVIEAVELPGHPFLLGLQWHPEKMQEDPAAGSIFKAFIGACVKRV